MLLAPPADGAGARALRLPARDAPPPIDEHLVEPETTRDEIIRGRRVVAMPALPPHADRHFKLDYVLGAHVKQGYIGSTELLTRPAQASNFATDTCIRREGIDPATGSRYLEELAFEVVNEQSLPDITQKAEDLIARGVRRVVAIFVKNGEVSEWSAKTGSWQKLDPGATFSDATLTRPMRVRELLDAAEADNAVARALLAKKNPVLLSASNESRAEGHTDGLREGLRKGLCTGIRGLCEVLSIPLSPEREEALSRMDSAELEVLHERIRRDRRWP